MNLDKSQNSESSRLNSVASPQLKLHASINFVASLSPPELEEFQLKTRAHQFTFNIRQ
jgi:hypothetical protein